MQAQVRALALDGVELILLRLERNLGFAAGCNLLIDRALGDAECNQSLMLNSDAVALPEWVCTMTTCVSQTPDSAGMVVARMHKLARPQEVDTLGISVYRGLMPADRHCLDDQLVEPSGGCCLLKTATLEDIHPVADYYFDALYFCYCEDTDLVIHAVLGGYQTIYVNEVLALHEGQASSGGGVRTFITYHGLRNSIWMHAKLFPASIFWRFGLLLVLAHMLSIARHGLFGRAGLQWRTYKDALVGCRLSGESALVSSRLFDRTVRFGSPTLHLLFIEVDICRTCKASRIEGTNSPGGLQESSDRIACPLADWRSWIE